VIDACVHPALPHDADLLDWLPVAYRNRFIAGSRASIYPLPVSPDLLGADPGDGRRAGSDPTLLIRQVLDEPGADAAVLLPLGRGLIADARAAAQVDAAINEWLVRTWLEDNDGAGRLRGSIRVTPRLPAEAVAEIERWADHPGIVQVVVPLEALTLYGEQSYMGIWAAAAEHGLPVAMLSDRGGGVLLPPTAAGVPMSPIEAHAQQALYGAAHVLSLIAHGVFTRLPELQWICADGAFDFLTCLLWRSDKEWRSTRAEVPWVTEAPSRRLGANVRCVVRYGDGPRETRAMSEFIERNELEGALLYGSGYPHWDHLAAGDLAPLLAGELREPVMDANARRLYGLAEPVASSA
jgi:predicted TIM-barrel fold metal-dependent hydrolase